MDEEMHVIDNDMGGTVTVYTRDLEMSNDDNVTMDVVSKNEYSHVAILENGWLKCNSPVDEPPEEDGMSVDYYPPDRVHWVGTIERR